VYLFAGYRPGIARRRSAATGTTPFLLNDGRVVITISDGLGEGLDVAVTMARLRQAMRSAATLLPEPNATMLTAAESAVRDVPLDSYATAMAGIYDPWSYEFTLTCAGHPGPTVLFRADGSVEGYTSRGVMLGLRPASVNETVTISADPGSALVVFTDGLTEATQDIDEGCRRLHAAIADAGVAAAENPARELGSAAQSVLRCVADEQ
jgi:sigma-B regulation protein RsbU (phosphoserine phosphatase)